MLLDLNKLVKKYNMDIVGVLHIGAHIGQENILYNKVGIKNRIFFEPLKRNFNILKKNVSSEGLCVNIALGSSNKDIEMYVELDNQSQSSSILEPNLHIIQYPNIRFSEKEVVQMKTLDSYFKDNNIKPNLFNMINIDVQGYELEVFRGANEVLKNIDYIFTEVNREDLYKNCVKIEELDEYLKERNFERVEVSWDGISWGDALYIKNEKNKNL